MSYLSVNKTNIKWEYDLIATNPSSIFSLSYIVLVSYLSVNKTNIKCQLNFVATKPTSILLPSLNSLSVLSIGEQD